MFDGKSVVDKDTAVPVHAMNAYEVRSGIVPLILTSALDGGE